MINLVWSAPLQITVCCYFMYVELGLAAFTGIAVLVIGILFNRNIAKVTSKYQKAQMNHKDGRIKLVHEMLNGIRYRYA